MIRPPRTLRARLVLAAGGAILAAVVVFGVATLLLVGNSLSGSLDGALRTRAQQVAQLAVSAPAVLTDPGALESPVSGRELVVEVIDAHGRILARSETLGARLLPFDRLAHQALSAGRGGYEGIGLDGRRFRLYAAPIAQAGGPAAGGVVLVASDTTDISHTLGHLGFVFAVAGAIVALLAVLAAAALTRRGLRPLARLAAGAAEIERTADAARRLPEPGAADEIGQLTGVLNRMLQSLEEARASERRFLADASHELRTPVTALLGNAEYLARHGAVARDDADAEALADLRRDAERLARLVDDLLVLERAGAGAGPRTGAASPQPIALDELVRETVSGDPRANGRLRIGELAPARVRGDEVALRRVLENLIENALVHGPTDGSVQVELVCAGGEARLSVADAGAGPDPGDLERLFERFWRGSGASQRPGSGLGLSIAQAIVEHHAGRIEVAGSRFTVVLPLVAADSRAGESANSHAPLTER